MSFSFIKLTKNNRHEHNTCSIKYCTRSFTPLPFSPDTMKYLALALEEIQIVRGEE
jgi:hypothetical protein